MTPQEHYEKGELALERAELILAKATPSAQAPAAERWVGVAQAHALLAMAGDAVQERVVLAEVDDPIGRLGRMFGEPASPTGWSMDDLPLGRRE